MSMQRKADPVRQALIDEFSKGAKEHFERGHLSAYRQLIELIKFLKSGESQDLQEFYAASKKETLN
ncbi:hypothetical protein [Hyphococcus sp.]|uniref:hypothetical protein n=1 Tax=Hyphococcus sp. TaxID=2038636 RepID=UPI003CCC3ABC